MAAVEELTPALGASAACRALGLWRGAPARRRSQALRAAFTGPLVRRAPRPRPPLALDAAEHQFVLDTLNSERFANTAPAAEHATLLDEGRYLGSVRTMYRVLGAHGGTRERRNQLVHPAYTKPELLAITPNQVWSWDITKLKGPAKWTCFHLYVILNIFSRLVVGWLMAAARTPSWPSSSSPTRWRATTSSPACSLCTPIAAPACAQNRWPRYWWTWTSPRTIAGPTSPTITRIPRRSSKP